MKMTVSLALLFGLPLAVFVAVSPYYPVEHSLWLRVNNTLTIATLAGAAAVGYSVRRERWPRSIGAVAGYTLTVVALFMAGYTITAWRFAGAMKWMPFVYRDYLYHGYTSVEAYLASGNNYVELLKLHLFSWAIFSLSYVFRGAARQGNLTASGSPGVMFHFCVFGVTIVLQCGPRGYGRSACSLVTV
jgi:hypothetical protein